MAVLLLLWKRRPWSFLVAGALLALQPILDLFVFNTLDSIVKTDNAADALTYVSVALVLAIVFGWLGFARDRTITPDMNP